MKGKKVVGSDAAQNRARKVDQVYWTGQALVATTTNVAMCVPEGLIVVVAVVVVAAVAFPFLLVICRRPPEISSVVQAPCSGSLLTPKKTLLRALIE
jgi:hypothetical protein